MGGGDPLQGILTGPLCTGELSCYDPGEGSDGHQGSYVQERRCALCVRRGRRDRGLKDRSRLSGHQHAADCLYLQDRQSCLHLSAEGGLWEFCYGEIPPCSSLSLGVEKQEWRRRCLFVARVLGKQCPCPQPASLTCREISSTSHSSSHSWATADMATTVEARMTTSTIWKREVPDGRVTAGVRELVFGRGEEERKRKKTEVHTGQ